MVTDRMIDSATHTPSGCRCTYIPHPKFKVGLKLFRTRRERDYARELQEKAYRVDAGPKVGRAVDLPFPFQGKKYGYLTEAVIVSDTDGDYCEDFARFRDKVFDTLGVSLGQARAELCNTLKEWDIHAGDMHDYNVGLKQINGKWKLVCIDFDEVSRGGI